VLQWATIPPHVGQQSVNFLHRGNVLQRLARAVTEVASGWQRGGKQAARGGKKPAKYQNLAWPACCLQSFHHVVITSSRRIDSWGFYNQLQLTTIFLEYPYGYD
jgi:hypothetical protein